MFKPWRASMGWGAAQVLELVAGGIALYGIMPGDRLQR
jgi:hypothetical protein